MREKGIHKIEVHVATICFYNGKVLIVKRNPDRKLYPCLWACGGGQLHADETFEQAVRRQAKQELGLELDSIKPFDTFYIKKAKIPGVVFACKVKNKELTLGNEHSEGKWVKIEELDLYDLIPGVKEQIQKAYNNL